MSFSLPEGAEAVERITISAQPSIPCAALHLARYSWAASKIIEDFDTPLIQVLDVACGTGYGTNLLASSPALCVGVDSDRDAIVLARKRHSIVEHPEGQAVFEAGRGEDYLANQPSSSFDWIVCFETLEHVDNLALLFSECLRVYHHGFLFSVPHNEPDGSWPFHKTFGITKEKIAALLPRDGHVISFYSQTPQPACQIEPYSPEPTRC